MPKLIVTEAYSGYDISWDYSEDKDMDIFELMGGSTTSQLKLDDTATVPEVLEFKELLRNSPGARMIEFLGRTTPIFQTKEEAQNCIDNVIEPFLLSMEMAGKKM